MLDILFFLLIINQIQYNIFFYFNHIYYYLNLKNQQLKFFSFKIIRINWKIEI